MGWVNLLARRRLLGKRDQHVKETSRIIILQWDTAIFLSRIPTTTRSHHGNAGRFTGYAHLSDSARCNSSGFSVYLFCLSLSFGFFPKPMSVTFLILQALSLKGRVDTTWVPVCSSSEARACLSQMLWLLSLSSPFSPFRQLLGVFTHFFQKNISFTY